MSRAASTVTSSGWSAPAPRQRFSIPTSSRPFKAVHWEESRFRCWNSRARVSGKTVIDWRIIQDRPSAAAFARTILALRRPLGDRTSISNALELGAALTRSSDRNIFATRKVIDVMGDGANNIGKPMEQMRNFVTKQGIVVNGLAVMDESGNGYFPNLDRYYQACVAGGRGAFVLIVRSYRDFAPAMRRKLILEISQNEDPKRQAREDFAQNNLLRQIATAKPARVQAPVLLRPARNEFSNHCDVADAPVASRAW